MNTAQTPISSTESVQLAPSYTLSISIVAIGLLLFLVQPWASAVVALFGLFLLLQTVMLKLIFTDSALDVYRGETLIRHFPYTEWQNWRIFWEPVPILFYFKEVKSIHFLPVLFDPKMLRACLEQRCPRIP